MKKKSFLNQVPIFMHNLKFVLALLTILFSASALTAQISLNLNLIAEINRGDTRYSGSWVYVDPLGQEYALVGAKTGTAIYWLDNPDGMENEVAFIPGPSTNWREITVVEDKAYVVTDVQDTDHSMQVIDLGALPDYANLISSYDDTFDKGHIIQKDIFDDSPYVYINGTTTTSGVHILDISDPFEPVEVGVYNPGYYIHDCHVRGNLLFAHAFFEPGTDVVDISDKSNPTFLYRIPDPNGSTHSSTMTMDGKYLMVANEQDGRDAIIWNIEDPNNLEAVATYTANYESLVHNPYIKGDFVYLAHNTEGLRIVDLLDPEVPVEVGFYDTFEGPSGGFSGLWSACPYLPSGRIIGGERTRGLMVWEWEEHRAGRVYVQVVDADTQNPIFNVDVIIDQDSLLTDDQGWARWGNLDGTFSAEVDAENYFAQNLDITITEDQKDTIIVALESSIVHTEASPQHEIFSFAPNPTKDQIQIQSEQAAEWRILDMKGKVLLTFVKSSGSHIINIQDLPSGTYIIQAVTAHNRWNQKLVKPD